MRLLVLLVLVGAACCNPGDRPAPRYVVNLDDPPLHRWKNVVVHFVDPIKEIVAYIDKRVSTVRKYADELMNVTKMPDEYRQEIQGVADATGIPLLHIMQANFFYELEHAFGEEIDRACTSIVVQASNGSVYHTRNMDLGFPALNALTIDVEFQKGGKTLYYGTTFAGYVGTATGMRADGYTVVAHTRPSLGVPAENIAAARKGGQIIGMNIRMALEGIPDFKTATQKFATEEYIVECYLISVGMKHNEGKVITRARDKAVNVWQLTDNRWFEVQTNDDHWGPPIDQRRGFVNKRMNETTPEAVTMGYMYKIISTPPDLQSDTVYSMMMSPSLHWYQGYIRAH